MDTHSIKSGTLDSIPSLYSKWLKENSETIDSIVATAGFSDAETGFLLVITYWKKK